MLTSGFYNSVNGDRKYDADQFSSFFDGILSDGVLDNVGQYFLLGNISGLSFTIGSGRAWFNKRWIYNDSPVSLQIEPAHTTYKRYDEVVIEVNNLDSVRNAFIKIVKGTPAPTPVRPTLLRSEKVNQYSIYTLGINANSTTINEIVARAGSAELPSARLNAAPIGGGKVSSHRNNFRGINLGTSFTDTQYYNVTSGTFEDMYVGDYWVIDGITWRIVDFNYWYNIPKDEHVAPKNHIVIMPDQVLYNAQMNSTDTTSTGYGNAGMRVYNLFTARDRAGAAFNNHLFIHKELLSSAATNGVPTGNINTDSSIEIPSEVQMYGSFVMGSYSGTSYESRRTYDYKQFALFRLEPSFIRHSGPEGSYMWLRDPVNASGFAIIGLQGEPNLLGASSSLGVRPYFAVGA